jgi:hypothetical protein
MDMKTIAWKLTLSLGALYLGHAILSYTIIGAIAVTAGLMILIWE